MEFRKLDLSSLEGVSLEDDALPGPKQFETPEQAYKYYVALIQSPVLTPVKPWARVPDAIRLGDRLLARFRQDWPELKLMMNDVAQQQALEAYYHLPGLRMAWAFANSVLGDESGSEDNQLLRDALMLREQLLGLAFNAYMGKPELLQRIDQIRALSRPNNSLYDEFTKDLIDTVIMFEENKFEESGDVKYPAKKLQDATQLAERLPLFAPQNRTTETSSAAKEAPLTHRAFALFAAASALLASWGRMLHFGDRNVNSLYPLRLVTSGSSSKAETPEGSDGPSEPPFFQN